MSIDTLMLIFFYCHSPRTHFLSIFWHTASLLPQPTLLNINMKLTAVLVALLVGFVAAENMNLAGDENVAGVCEDNCNVRIY